MAKSNFNYIYQTLPNLFFKTDDEVLETANCIYPGDEQKQDEYIQRVYEGQRVLDECEIKDLKSFIKKVNETISSKGEKLYYCSMRLCDQREGYTLMNIKIFIEPGNYEGAQLSVNDEYKYLNKTNRKLVRDCLVKIAKEFRLWAYDLAYRFSNGETGFTKVREY